MKIWNRLLLTLLCVTPLAMPDGVSAQRRIETANHEWLFRYREAGGKAPKGIPPEARTDCDESDWQRIAIPHTWQTYETTGELHPFIASPHARDNARWWDGKGFYRKHFRLRPEMRGRKLFIEFDGVMKNCLAYLNGHLIGEHLGGYGCFYFDLTDYVDYEGDNLFVLEVSNQQTDPQQVPPMDAGCWNFYGGIYRNVRLVSTSNVFIPFQGSYKHEGGTHITTENPSDTLSRVRIRTWVRNERQERQAVVLTTSIVDGSRKIVASATTPQNIHPQETALYDETFEIASPERWSPAHPHLYKVVSTVNVGTEYCDRYESVFGIRTFTWDHAGQLLHVNGEPVNIQGFNRHQEYPWLGDALPYFIHRMDLLDMKYNLNCTALRPGQYCSGPEVFSLADSLGLMTFAELPNVKNRPFSPEAQWMQTVEMVRRLRNHPSVLLFDMGDETYRAADSRWAYMESPRHFITCRHCEESGGRFVSITPQELRMSKMLQCSVRGWYGDDEKPLRPENQQWTSNDEFRHQVALDGKKPGSADDRIDQRNLMVWLYADHGCDREYRNAPLLHYNPKGWVDSYRVPKYAYYLWQANYASRPMVFAMPHYWRQQYLGERRQIVVDSNCEEVELFVGSRSLGTRRPTAENRHSVTFPDVEVCRKTLRVEGRNRGVKVAEYLLPMAGRAEHLTLTASHTTVDAALDGVFLVTANIVDRRGNHIYGARPAVKWEVEGPATLVGPAEYVSQFDDSAARTGSLYIDMPVSNVVRPTGEPGEIRIRISAEGLVPAETVVRAISRPTDKNITQ